MNRTVSKSIVNNLLKEKYTRTIPRDLFNEAKLLKCLGALAILVHNNQIPDLEFDDNIEGGFVIEQDENGDLYAANVNFYIRDNFIPLKCQYNSKDNYTMFTDYNGDIVEVFEDSGALTKEFTDLIASIEYQNDLFN